MAPNQGRKYGWEGANRMVRVVDGRWEGEGSRKAGSRREEGGVSIKGNIVPEFA